jgi:curved DNA-binding protein
MEFKDYYAVMGLARDATAEQVKQAYRKLARKYHPDVSKESDAEKRFKDVGEAYEVLGDPEKRAAYDQLGSGPRAGEDFRPPPGWGSGSGPDDSSEFFESLFGRAGRAGRGDGRTRRARDRGEDLHARIVIDLDASLEGGTRALMLGERTLNVRIPKGIQEGQHIRLAGQGEKPPGTGAAGDLLLEVAFAPHRLYRAEGRDLQFDLPVTPWEAALGATVTVPTPSGPVALQVPAGSRDGARLRLRGRGLPANPPGDLQAVLQVVLPPADNAVSRAAYEAFAAAVPFNPRSSLGVTP